MMRHTDEILASQQKMLRRRGRAGSNPGDADTRAHFENHLVRVHRFLEKAAHLDTLWCDYNELLRRPPDMISQVVTFLALNLDQPKMIAAIDPRLHRQRHAGAPTRLC